MNTKPEISQDVEPMVTPYVSQAQLDKAFPAPRKQAEDVKAAVQRIMAVIYSTLHAQEHGNTIQQAIRAELSRAPAVPAEPAQQDTKGDAS